MNININTEENAGEYVCHHDLFHVHGHVPLISNVKSSEYLMGVGRSAI